MVHAHSLWQQRPQGEIPDSFLAAVQRSAPQSGRYAAQLLWQRGIRDLQTLSGFLNPDCYTPTSPFAFGEEMEMAIARLGRAFEQQERVAIWGDFDADGITATAVLWEGLAPFFPHSQQLTYYIPNRLTDSHGLSCRGLERLARDGYQLIVTCDTGSTNPDEIRYAHQLGLEIIVTDHHTLPPDRPEVVAILNPRTFPGGHPLATLSGVAVAYKLVEALYQTYPDLPMPPLETLLDLVAIGLIADLVNLQGDCRYLAQRGIQQLQRQRELAIASRPGVAKLLEYCKRTGDRPTDISFGLGPRINAISRVYGDARFAVELLTTREPDQGYRLAERTELANTRRKSLQKEVAQQVRSRLAQLDLSTTRVIVLADSQWSVGVLGLVAAQIAQEYNRPTILLSTLEAMEAKTEDSSMEGSDRPPLSPLPPGTPSLMARGSARSVPPIDLYQLVQSQSHLLDRFGGHPYAAGLSLRVENLGLFTEAVNRQLREQQMLLDLSTAAAHTIDLTVTVVELGKDLFQNIKVLEPFGMGNPPPRLLIQNCWFDQVKNSNIRDLQGRKQQYIKTEFEIWDETTQQGFPGVWWEHYRDDIPTSRCDAIAELDFNPWRQRYEIRLIALRPTETIPRATPPATVEWLVDWRGKSPLPHTATIQPLIESPTSWEEVLIQLEQARQRGKDVAIAYPPPLPTPPLQIWEGLIGLAKYLSRTGIVTHPEQLRQRLNIGSYTLKLGLDSLRAVGYHVDDTLGSLTIQETSNLGQQERESRQAIARFLAAVQEEKFRRQYFYNAPFDLIRTVAAQMIPTQTE